MMASLNQKGKIDSCLSLITVFLHLADFNLRTICDVLGAIETKWFKIGIQLGISHEKLLQFHGSPDPLSAVINEWLKGNVMESDVPISWESIAKALKSKYVGEPRLAEEINMTYCQQNGTFMID